MSVNSIIFQYIGAENECKSKHLSLGSLAQLIASKKYAKRVEMLRRSITTLIIIRCMQTEFLASSLLGERMGIQDLFS